MNIKWMTDDEAWIGWSWSATHFVINFKTQECCFTDNTGYPKDFEGYMEETLEDKQRVVAKNRPHIFFDAKGSLWSLYLQAKSEWALKQLEAILLNPSPE